MEYEKIFGALIAVAFGWLLGLLGPAIVKRIERSYRKDELKRALLSELDELAQRMTATSFFFRDQAKTLDDQYLDWAMKKLVRQKSRYPVLGNLAHEMTKVPLPERTLNRGGKSLVLVQHPLPLLTVHINEIVLFPMAFQEAVMTIYFMLQTYNQRTQVAQKFLDRIFEKTMTEENHAKTLQDIDDLYDTLCTQCCEIADRVEKLDR
jgi:hypothetical protein